MGKRISSQTRKELLEAMRRRYRDSRKMDKTRILDEFVALTGYHRKHGVRLLGQPCNTEDKAVQNGLVRSGRVYDEAVASIVASRRSTTNSPASIPKATSLED